MISPWWCNYINPFFSLFSLVQLVHATLTFLKYINFVFEVKHESTWRKSVVKWALKPYFQPLRRHNDCVCVCTFWWKECEREKNVLRIHKYVSFWNKSSVSCLLKSVIESANLPQMIHTSRILWIWISLESFPFLFALNLIIAYAQRWSTFNQFTALNNNQSVYWVLWMY